MLVVLWYMGLCLCLLGRICQAIPSVPTGMPGVNMPLIGLGTGGHWVRNSSAVYEGTKLGMYLPHASVTSYHSHVTQQPLGWATGIWTPPMDMERFVTLVKPSPNLAFIGMSCSSRRRYPVCELHKYVANI